MHSHGDSPHHHGHHHAAPVTYDKAFIISIIANGLFVILQIVFSYLSNSTSLLADAFHNLGDVLGLILAWIAAVLMKRAPTRKSTYGLKKSPFSLPWQMEFYWFSHAELLQPMLYISCFRHHQFRPHR